MAKTIKKHWPSKTILDSTANNTDYQAWIEDKDNKPNSFEETTPHIEMVHRLKAVSIIHRLVELCEQDMSINSEVRSLVKSLQVELHFSFVSTLTEPQASPGVPDCAPQLWSERSDRNESPIDFIKRVYEAYLGKGISKPDIKRLDLKLYRAFYNWKAKKMPIPSDFDEYLPNKSVAITKQLEASGLIDGNINQATRSALSLYRTARNRQNRRKTL